MTPIEDLEARLAKMDDAFKSAPSDGGGGFWLPPVGIYQGILRSLDFFETKADQRALLKLTYEIVLAQNRDLNGREIDFVYNLEPQGTPDEIEFRLSFLKRDLKTLGIPVDSDEFSFAQVRPGSPIWDDVMDVPVEIEVKESKKLDPKTGKPWTNAYLQARLGDPLPAGQLPGSDIPMEGMEPVAPVKADDESDPVPF
jgi:hypothetical protein